MSRAAATDESTPPLIATSTRSGFLLEGTLAAMGPGSLARFFFTAMRSPESQKIAAKPGKTTTEVGWFPKKTRSGFGEGPRKAGRGFCQKPLRESEAARADLWRSAGCALPSPLGARRTQSDLERSLIQAKREPANG